MAARCFVVGHIRALLRLEVWLHVHCCILMINADNVMPCIANTNATYSLIIYMDSIMDRICKAISHQ